jgi:histidinol-phosphate aminotransferase
MTLDAKPRQATSLLDGRIQRPVPLSEPVEVTGAGAQPCLNTDLQQLPIYLPGRSIEEVKTEFGLAEVHKLASNENPLGPSPLALAAAQAALERAHRYPGVMQRELCAKLAERLGVTPGQIVLGNGGTDVLRMIAQAFVFGGGNSVMSQATFPMYRILTSMFGGKPRQVKPLADYGHDLVAMAEAVDEDTRLLYLCSPNNPTGSIITQAECDDLLARLPGHVVVVLDESYCDFVDDAAYADGLAYVSSHPNLMVVRSFSKSAGLANLRVGYGVASADLAAYLRHTCLPFYIGDIALAAAAASLDDCDYQQRSRAVVLAGRAYLAAGLRDLGLHCLPSQGNFVTFVDPLLPPAELVQALLQRGFIVRAMNIFGMPNAIRVSVGAPAANEKFVAALRVILEAGTPTCAEHSRSINTGIHR